MVLNWSARERRLVNHWAADHTHSLAGGQPILALDCTEHAYRMDYGAKAAAYVDAFVGGDRLGRGGAGASPNAADERLSRSRSTWMRGCGTP